MLLLAFAENAGQLTTFIGILLAIVTTLIAVGSAITVQSRTTGLSASVTTLNEANEGLRRIIADNEAQRIADNAECDRKLHEQKLEYTNQISELQGRVSVLTSDLATEMVKAAIQAATSKGVDS